MRIVVESTSCVGHGRCAVIGPEIFELDDLGYVEQRDLVVPAGLEDAAERGANACPERAITVLRD